MPTLSEILAKKAGGGKPSPAPTENQIILMESGPHYAKEVDGDGRFVKWVPRPKVFEAASWGGIKITPDSERAALAANIKETFDGLAPKPLPQLPQAETRELGAMEPGERLPMDYPPKDAPAGEWAWFNSLHSVEGSLGIVMEPESGYGWLAVQHNAHQGPLLIKRLPLLNHQENNNPF